MKSRPTNQRISRQVDAYEQAKQRTFKQQQLREIAGPYVKVSKVRKLLAKFLGKFRDWFGTTSIDLDLRGAWARDPSRSDGAKQLRAWFPKLQPHKYGFHS